MRCRRVVVRPAAATPADMQAAIAKVVGDAKLNAGRVKLDIPPLVENGNTVPCAVTVDSPMTPTDHVKAIHVFNEKNPQPNVISANLGPAPDIMALEGAHVLQTYRRAPVVFERGSGCRLYDATAAATWTSSRASASRRSAMRIRGWSRRSPRRRSSCCTRRTCISIRCRRRSRRGWRRCPGCRARSSATAARRPSKRR